MAKPKVSGFEELYCQSYVLHGGKKNKAYEDAGYSMKMSKAKIATEADKIYNRPNVSLRIEELQKLATTVYIKTKQDKLLILEEVMSSCKVKCEEKGMLNAAAVTAAIKTHNEMQGDNAPIETNTNLKVTSALADRLTGGSKR
ncbi:MAG: hypothetical protein JKY50_00495 [Oleispira sp.]|nr:hypothetical protein [Oleispira sp.]